MSILQSIDADFPEIDLVSGHNDIQVASFDNKMREPTDGMGYKYTEKWKGKATARKRTGGKPRSNAKSLEDEETDILKIEESLIEIAARLESSNGSTQIPNTSKGYGDILNMATELLDSIEDQPDVNETFNNVSSHEDYLEVSKKLEESNKGSLKDNSSETSSPSSFCKIVSVTSINDSKKVLSEKLFTPQKDSLLKIVESNSSSTKSKEPLSRDESDLIVLEDLGIRLETNKSKTSNNSEVCNAPVLTPFDEDEMDVEVIDIDELLLEGKNNDSTDEIIDVEDISSEELDEVIVDVGGVSEDTLERPSLTKQTSTTELIELDNEEELIELDNKEGHFETNDSKTPALLKQNNMYKTKKIGVNSEISKEKSETNAFKKSSSTKKNKTSTKSGNYSHVSSSELKKRWTESFLSNDKGSKKKNDVLNKVNDSKHDTSTSEFQFKTPGTPMSALKKAMQQKSNSPSTSSKHSNAFKVPNIPKLSKPPFKKSSPPKASKSQPKPFGSTTLAALERETQKALKKREKEILDKVSKIKGLTPFNLLDHLTEEEIIILGGEISEVCKKKLIFWSLS